MLEGFRQAKDQLVFIWCHPSNQGQRVASIRRGIAYQVRARVLGQTAVGRVGERGRVRVTLHDTGSSQTIYANPTDYNELMFWKDVLRPGDLFLDVGANVGIYSLWAVDHGAEAWAFEPIASARERLESNAQLSAMDIRVHPFALGSESGTLVFTDDLGTSNRMSTDGRLGSGRVEVAVDTLDAIFGSRHARGMKVDVEGAERLVLEGSGAALSNARIDFIQLEWNRVSELVLGEDRSAVAALMRKAGYMAFRPTPNGVCFLSEDSLAEYGADVFFASPQVSANLRPAR